MDAYFNNKIKQRLAFVADFIEVREDQPFKGIRRHQNRKERTILLRNIIEKHSQIEFRQHCHVLIEDVATLKRFQQMAEGTKVEFTAEILPYMKTTSVYSSEKMPRLIQSYTLTKIKKLQKVEG